MLGDYTGNGSRKGSQGGLGLLEIWRKNTPGVKDRRGKKKYGSCYSSGTWEWIGNCIDKASQM